MANSLYWLYRWMDEHGASDAPDVSVLLRNQRCVEEFREAAFEAEGELNSPVDASAAIVAGAAIDLTGSLDCIHPDCRMKQVNTLFRRAWHYFDTIIVSEQLAHSIARHWREDDPQYEQWVFETIQLYSTIRKLGAADLVTFREKPRMYSPSWRENAKKAGLSLPIERIEHLTVLLADRGQVDRGKKTNHGVQFAFDHPLLEHTKWVVFPEVEVPSTETKLRRKIAEIIIDEYSFYLVKDVCASRYHNAALGSTVEMHHEILQPTLQPVTPDTVAFNLSLPVLEGVPVDVLIRLRVDEKEAFQRFRSRLREAVAELAARSNEAPAERAAAEIYRDLIEPELRAIRDKLSAAHKLLAKRSTMGIALGGLATTCGLLLGPPGYAAGAIGAVLGAQAITAAIDKDLERKADIALSDMYFLWEAAKHGHHDL